MILNDHETKNKQLLVKTINNQSVEINDLKLQLQVKLHLKGKFSESQTNHSDTSVKTKLSKPSTSGTKLYSVTLFPKSKVIPKVEKNDLSKLVTSHLTTKKIIEECTQVLAPTLLKIESEPINAYFKNNRAVHRDYLKVTKEHIATLQELLKEARALKPLDEHIDLEVPFRKHTCFVQNLEGVDLLVGSRGYNLYTISMADMMKSSPICLLSNKFLRTKDEAPEIIIKFLKQAQVSLNAKVGITHNTSTTRTPQQNGVAERRNRTLVEAVRTMLIFSKSSLFLWAKAVATDLRKLQPKADIGIFIGYSPSKKAYWIYNKRTRQIMETMNIQFDELTQMDSKQLGLGPDFHSLTSRHISSGLVLNQAASTSAKPPTKND
ncbi:retrovirus-related pol polyprotein from transposon TNT 1-94 [Tanacetum coccineum]